jgi:hypothetical protein
MQPELPTITISENPKRRHPALFILGIGSFLLATLCTLYFFTQSETLTSTPLGTPRELYSPDFLASTPRCPNGASIFLSGLTQNSKSIILSAHNHFRSIIAQGLAPGQPGASDMLEMVWNDQVAAKAQAWADQCSFSHNTAAGRTTTQFSYVGQNLIYTKYSLKATPANFTQMIESFYKELSVYRGGSAPVSSFSYNSYTGHYTQLAWANSYALGCGYKKYVDGGMYAHLLVCNYGPGGNYSNQKMYTKGTFNSKYCKKGASSVFKALCKA